jgi:hypothetical protein
MLLEAGTYGCVVLEPYDRNYYGREQEGPYFGFIGELKSRGIPVLIGSHYSEKEFQKAFGLTDYAGYKCKPWLDYELEDEVRRILNGTK